jgi:hypothetical protein
VAGSCFFVGGQNGTCEVRRDRVVWRGDIPGQAGAPDNVLSITYEVRVAGGTRFDTEACIGTTLFYDADEAPGNEASVKFGACTLVDCPPTVDPNRQLGGQVHFPILNFVGGRPIPRKARRSTNRRRASRNPFLPGSRWPKGMTSSGIRSDEKAGIRKILG